MFSTQLLNARASLQSSNIMSSANKNSYLGETKWNMNNKPEMKLVFMAAIVLGIVVLIKGK
jgi:hypothetical protein